MSSLEETKSEVERRAGRGSDIWDCSPDCTLSASQSSSGKWRDTCATSKQEIWGKDKTWSRSMECVYSSACSSPAWGLLVIVETSYQSYCKQDTVCAARLQGALPKWCPSVSWHAATHVNTLIEKWLHSKPSSEYFQNLRNVMFPMVFPSVVAVKSQTLVPKR